MSRNINFDSKFHCFRVTVTVTKCYKVLSIFISLSALLAYFVGKTESKILRLGDIIM